MHLLLMGVGTDKLVMPVQNARLAYQSMVEDLVFISCIATALNAKTATLENMQKVNFRYVLERGLID